MGGVWGPAFGGLLKAGRRHSVAARQCALVKGNGDGRARTHARTLHTARCKLHAAQEIAIDLRPALALLGRPLEGGVKSKLLIKTQKLHMCGNEGGWNRS